MYHSIIGTFVVVAVGTIFSYLSPAPELIYPEQLLHPIAKYLSKWCPGRERNYELRTLKTRRRLFNPRQMSIYGIDRKIISVALACAARRTRTGLSPNLKITIPIPESYRHNDNFY